MAFSPVLYAEALVCARALRGICIQRRSSFAFVLHFENERFT